MASPQYGHWQICAWSMAGSTNREVVGRLRRGFGLEGVVPPLHRIVDEAEGPHRFEQRETVGTLRRSNLLRFGVGAWIEHVERRAHVEFPAIRTGTGQQPEIHGGAATVARDLGDVIAQQLRLVEPWVIVAFSALVAQI